MNVRVIYTETTYHDVVVSVDLVEVRHYLAGLTGTGALPDTHQITTDELRTYIEGEGISAFPVVSGGETPGERRMLDVVAVRDSFRP